MALIDRLLKKARALCNEILEDMYSMNADFIEALGLNPKSYEVLVNGEVMGYDDMKALADACGVWDE